MAEQSILSCSPVGCKRILVYFELENRTSRRHFWLFVFALNVAPKNKTAVSTMSAGTAFKKVAERRRSVALRLNLSTAFTGVSTHTLARYSARGECCWLFGTFSTNMGYIVP